MLKDQVKGLVFSFFQEQTPDERMVVMQVAVSKHAIERCRDRVPRMMCASDTEIEEFLTEVVLRGTRLGRRPSLEGRAYEYEYQGLYVIGVINKGRTTVVTCYGDESYRKWLAAQRRRRACRLRRAS